MMPPADPLLRLRRRSVATAMIAVPLLALSAAWALRPLHQKESAPPRILPPPPDAPEAPAAPALNIAAFDAQLWCVPPPPMVKAPEPPPPPEVPLRLKLIGIMHEEREGAAIDLAVLYDADSNRLLFAECGQKLGRHTVTRISESGVELTTGRARQTLLLDERTKPSKRGGGA